MTCRIPAVFFLVAAVTLFANSLSAAEVRATRSDNGVAVTIDGQPFAEYVVESGGKPIVWPIIGPTGKPMTRAYPMAEQPGERKDHQHHRSLWFTHGDVNGYDFWHGRKGERIV